MQRDRPTPGRPARLRLVAALAAVAWGGATDLHAGEAGGGAGAGPGTGQPSGQAAESGPIDAATTVQALIIAGRREADAQHLERARELYLQALILAPGHAEARAGLVGIDALIAGRASAADGIGTGADLARQIAEVDIRLAMQQAELLAQSGRFADAIARLDTARSLLTRTDHGGSAIAAIDVRIGGYRADMARAHERRTSEVRVGERLRAEATAATDRDMAQGRRSERLRRIQAMRDRQHYEVALATTRRLLVEYPGDPEAERLFSDLLGKVHDQRRLDLAERERELRQEVAERSERALLPTGFDGMPIFPTDWRERHEDRVALDAEPELPSWKEAILDQLATRVTFDFDAQNGLDAVRALAMQGNVNLLIDPAITSGPEHLVTLKGRAMRLDHAFSWIARAMGTAWEIDQGAVYIGAARDIEPTLLIHDIAGLTFVGLDHPGRAIGYASTGSVGGQQSLFTGPTAAAEAKTITPEDVVDLIKRSIAPASWSNPRYAIEIRGNLLYVTAPTGVQVLIREFIRAQAQLRNLLVKIDLSWLTLADGFLEEIGVDWTNRAELLSPTRNGLYQRNRNGTEYSAATNHPLPASAVTVQPSTANDGLQLHSINLGSPELSSLFTAIERNHKGQVLAAPSVTTLNGVRANCFFGSQIAYIADYEIVGGNYDPKIEVLTTGVSLDVKPYVSADRKYVTMDLSPAIATVSFFTELLQAPRTVGGFVPGGIPILDDEGNIIGFDGADLVGYPIELPNVAIRAAGTTVRIPDQGTMMIGGFGNAVEQTSNNQIPFLGNIPFVGRLFGKRGRYSSRTRAYLLATVHIINYDELEAKL